MSEKIMPVSVEAFLTNARKLKDLPSSNFLTLAEALAEFRPFQGAVIEFDDAPEGGISLAMYDVIDAAGKFGGDVFKVGEYGKLWVVAMQAVLWTRYQQRKQSL